MSMAKQTTDHDEIRHWSEVRGGRPARVRSTADDGGILRSDFGEVENSLEEISSMIAALHSCTGKRCRE